MTTEMLFGLLGVVIGAIISLIGTILVLRNNIKLEIIKLHGLNKVTHYQNLYEFSQLLYKTCVPLSEHTENDFTELMKLKFNEIIKGYPYFNKKILKRLVLINGIYTCYILM